MKCYLCDSSDFCPRDGAVRDNPSLKILECAQCGLVMLDSFQHISADHYADSGMHGNDDLSIESWLKQVEQDDQRRIDMLKVSMVNRRLLDFGCGAAQRIAGFPVRSARRKGVLRDRQSRRRHGVRRGVGEA